MSSFGRTPHTPVPEALSSLQGLFDLFVDGINLTARLTEAPHAAIAGRAGSRPLAAEPRQARTRLLPHLLGGRGLEIGLEADGVDALLSVYRVGPSPRVAVFDRRLPLANLTSAVAKALEHADTHEPLGRRRPRAPRAGSALPDLRARSARASQVRDRAARPPPTSASAPSSSSSSASPRVSDAPASSAPTCTRCSPTGPPLAHRQKSHAGAQQRSAVLDERAPAHHRRRRARRLAQRARRVPPRRSRRLAAVGASRPRQRSACASR